MNKRVTFNLVPVVHRLVVWDFAYRQARNGKIWMTMACDRMRFAKRIEQSPIKALLPRNH
jgi:hypothetical protein